MKEVGIAGPGLYGHFIKQWPHRKGQISSKKAALRDFRETAGSDR